MTDIMVCLLAFKSPKKGNLYLDYAIKLIQKIQLESTLQITLMTDDRDYFKNKLVHIVDCFDPSYTKKLDVCKIAIKYGYTAVYIDVDTTLDFGLLEKTNFNGGFHYWWWWKTELRNFYHLKDRSYFKNVEEYCNNNKLKIEEAPLIHEGFFVIKKSNHIEDFFKVYDELSPIAVENDIKRGNFPTGRGEGLLIGIALINSEFKDNGCSEEILLLGHKLSQDNSPELKHLRNTITDPNLLDKKTFI